MTTQTMSPRNMTSLLILLVICGSLVSGAFNIMQDNWIAVLLMGAVYLPVILMYARICSLYPGKGLFDIVETIFGGFFGAVIIMLLSLYCVIVSGLILQNYTEFTVIISLNDTPKIPILILLLLVSLFLAYKGPELLGRWSFIILILIILHFIVTVILSLDIFDVKNILPALDHSFREISSNTMAVGSVAVGETLVALVFFGQVTKHKKTYRVYISGILIGVLIFTLLVLRNLMILGPDLEQAAQFATYMAVRIIKIGNFFERMESSISFIYILLGITKLALFLSAAAIGVGKLLKSPDYKRILIPTGLLALAFSSIVFKNAMEMFDFVWVYKYISIPFQLLIPLIIWITAEIRKTSVINNVH